MTFRPLWLVVLTNVVATYTYCFAANALTPPEGPHASTTYWLTQAWVYAMIAPIAVVAAWRGARQVLDAWAGRPRWWRLPLEGAACGAGIAFPVLASSGHGMSEIAKGVLLAGAACAGLGMLLTAINYPLARLLGRAGSGPSAELVAE